MLLENLIEELVGKRPLSDTPQNIPGTADMLLAMMYYAKENDSPTMPHADAKPRRRSQLMADEDVEQGTWLDGIYICDTLRAIHAKKREYGEATAAVPCICSSGAVAALTETFFS